MIKTTIEDPSKKFFIAKSLGLGECLLLGHGEEKSGARDRDALLEDTLEAFIAAIYLDLGYATARKTILDVVVPYIKDPNITFFSDYKSSLQEL